MLKNLFFFLIFSGIIMGNEIPKQAENIENEIIETKNTTVSTSEMLLSFINKQNLPSYRYEEVYDEILKSAGIYEVDPLLIAAIIKQESNYEITAVSSAGAIGLMQLMPGTATAMGVEDPWDIEENIRGGVKYFKQCLEKNAGDISLALASYNAGLGSVLKYGGIPPFEETQNYVNNVIKTYNKEFKKNYTYNEVEFEKAINGIFSDITFQEAEKGEI